MYVSGERIVVSPTSGVDRYPAFTRQVQSQADAADLFALIDATCALDGSVGPLEDVARWRLVWTVRTPQRAGETLRALAATGAACP